VFTTDNLVLYNINVAASFMNFMFFWRSAIVLVWCILYVLFLAK